MGHDHYGVAIAGRWDICGCEEEEGGDQQNCVEDYPIKISEGAAISAALISLSHIHIQNLRIHKFIIKSKIPLSDSLPAEMILDGPMPRITQTLSQMSIFQEHRYDIREFAGIGGVD